MRLIHMFLLVAIVLGCSHEELVMEIDPPDLEPIPTLICYYTEGQEDLLARYALNYSPYEFYDTLSFLRNSNQRVDPQSDLTLYIEDQMVGQFELLDTLYDRFYTHRLALDSASIFTGNTLRIHGMSPEFGDIQASQTVPDPPTLSRVKGIGKIGTSDITGYYGEELHGVEITLQDAPGEHFYQISIVKDTIDRRDSTAIFETQRMQIQNPLFVGFLYATYYLNDQTFENEDFSFVLAVVGQITENTKVVIRSLTKEWYRHDVAFITLATPFFESEITTSLLSSYREPIQVPGNVEGGLGFFGAAAENVYDIDL